MTISLNMYPQRFYLMKKRGQITIFLVVAVVILILAGLYFYLGKSGAKTGAAKAQEAKETDIVKAYVESCIKNVAERSLFERIGEQGGYIDVNANLNYGEDGTAGSPISPSYILFQGKNVPFYLEAKCNRIVNGKCENWTATSYVPELEAISKKLANYIAVEFEKCFDKNVFESRGIKIEKPVVDYKAINFDFSRSNVNVEVNVNEEDVSVKFYYPLTVGKGETKSRLDSFVVVLPVRLNATFEGSQNLIADMKESIESRRNTDYISDAPFIIVPFDCTVGGPYVKKTQINLYTKPAASSRIVEFADYGNYFTGRPNSYLFRFAVKNIAVNGDCS